MFPWLVLVALTIPLIIVARRKVYPHIVYPIALLIPTVLTAGIMFNAAWLVPALVADSLILIVSLLDLFTLPSTSTLRAERHHHKVASIVKNSDVAFRMINESSRRLRLTLLDDLPETFEVEESIFHASIGGHETKEFQYSFKPTKRGQFNLRCIHVRSRSLFGFWVRHLTVPVETQIHVYPDLHQLSHYALLARTNRLNLLGVRRTRKVGQDNEFERLREYTRDDHYRNINWRSTARHNKLIVQDYQNTQSQRIIFLIDCGRMMTN